MVPLAFGTQTSGSIIRPASYCGVVGYKPSFDLVETYGVSGFARSFDTIGIFARSVPDAALGIEAVTGLELQPYETPPRHTLSIYRSPVWDMAMPELQAAWSTFEQTIASHCATPPPFTKELDQSLSEVPALHARMMEAEASEALAYESAVASDQLSPGLREQIESGRAQSAATRYHDRLALLALQQRIASSIGADDVWLTPATTGPAPAFESGTGDSIFNRIWSALGLPCCTVPILSDTQARPIGVQVVSRYGNDRLVLSVAQWLMEQFGNR
jgi:Asp-tRNA(Asn)/Glu-tRNA(Gln) amidotransferase A subunit family amidase